MLTKASLERESQVARDILSFLSSSRFQYHNTVDKIDDKLDTRQITFTNDIPYLFYYRPRPLIFFATFFRGC